MGGREALLPTSPRKRGGEGGREKRGKSGLEGKRQEEKESESISRPKVKADQKRMIPISDGENHKLVNREKGFGTAVKTRIEQKESLKGLPYKKFHTSPLSWEGRIQERNRQTLGWLKGTAGMVLSRACVEVGGGGNEERGDA